MTQRTSTTAVSFSDISISTVNPAKQLVSNVSGYVIRGGITAVLGPTASGKSLLMRALSGRVHNLRIQGDFFVEGQRVDCRKTSTPISYVSQDDVLIGDLSARETLYNNAAMKRNKPSHETDRDVKRLLDILGLAEVADNFIGTVFKRGLSGGQKKRVEIGAELVAAPLVLFLDEPTSGLDAFIAYDVLKSIHTIAKASSGKLSIVLSIHQPNSRILELIDHIMVLGDGRMTFFGTVQESIEHMSAIGFPLPRDTTPTDYFLHVSDRNFLGQSGIDFAGCYTESHYFANLDRFIKSDTQPGSDNFHEIENGVVVTPRVEYCHDDAMSDSGSVADHIRFLGSESGMPTFMRQYTILVLRDFAIAIRDPALYYLQFVLIMVFGFLVGAAFFQLKFEIGNGLNNIPGGLLWITFMMAFVQIFKIYHLCKTSERFCHERANNTYSVPAAFCAELTATAVGLLTYLPGTAVPYFMMGFPRVPYPFIAFTLWMSALTAESMVNFISRMFPDATTAIIVCQGVLILLTVFGGGVFIPWNSTPKYWIWLQEISVFTQSSRVVITHASSYIDYKCVLTGGRCVSFGQEFLCDPGSGNSEFCMIKGREVLHTLQGTSRTDSPWKGFGYLVLIFFVSRISVLILMYFPADRIAGKTRGLVTKSDKASSTASEKGTAISHSDDSSKDIQDLVPESTDLKAEIEQFENRRVEVLFREVQGPSNAPFYPQGDMAPSCLEWTDLSLTLKKKGKVLIDTMSGTARSGRVLALMGPSGAGKTTLLNALGNRAPYGIVKGEITFGQRPFVTSDLYFVPQFDEVNDNLTVYEQIELVGLLKCSDDKDMHTRLDVVLRSLGLFEKSSMSCKGLTGGELKKVSVGMGMISNPKVLFLDEPTTGLDSTAAYYIVKHLVDVAVSFNIAIILTMHQPAKMVFDLLQDLYLLEGGRLVFNGPLSCSERYFYSLGHICRAGINPADFYLDLVSKPPDTAEGLSWQKLYSTSKFAENYASEQHALVLSGTAAPAASQSSSTLKSLYHLLVFFFKYYCRDKGFYFHRIVSVVCISFFSGTLFLQLSPETSNLPKYTGALLFNMWTIMFSVVSATGLIARDRRQVVEQVKNAVLGPGTYCFAQFVASLPFNFVAALVFQSVFHWLTNINPDSMAFLYSLFISWGHLLLMEAFMLCIVEALKNAMLCVTCAIVVLGYLFLFAGFFVKVSDMPTWISWISYIAPTKYSFDGYLYEIFHSQEFFITGISPKVYLSGDYLLKELFTQSDVEPWSRFGALVAWIFLLRLTHYGIFLFQVLPYIEKRSTNPVPETQGSTIKRNSSIRQC